MTHEQNQSAAPSPEPSSVLTVPMSVWVELFYDLVFVAAILVLSAAASHLEDGVRVARIVAWVRAMACSHARVTPGAS